MTGPGVLRRGTVCATIVVLAACQTSLPPSATAEPSAGKEDEAARAAAAATLQLPAERLLATEDGYVGVRFVDGDTVLQLVLARPDGGSWRPVVLAAAAEKRVDPLRVTLSSLHAVVCGPDVGLTRSIYLFGQETSGRTLTLVGIPSIGGAVADETFVFAMEGSPEEMGEWAITADGSPRSNGDGRVFAQAANSGADQGEVGCTAG